QSHTFCPLVLFHDDPSNRVVPSLEHQSLIDRHRAKTNEMLQHNAQIWFSTATHEDDQHLDVSPSTSTSSASSASSWSSNQSPSLGSDMTPPSSLSSSSLSSLSSSPSPIDAAAHKRRRGNLPKEVTEYLKGWLVDHKKHPYPSEKEKIQLANRTGLTVNQISNWFINARRRILQPLLESESLNARLVAYSEMALEKKRRQLDIYSY
ncbi:homeobox KN domain-containing protein, partial [Dichotomocladium elegans]